MSSRFLMHCTARLLALAAALASVPLLAQPGHGAHQAVADAVAVAPTAAAAASKPVARKPRPQLGIGAAFAPDGSLWIVGLTAPGQLFVQSAAPATGLGAPQWGAPRVLDTAGDPISADGENHPKLLFGPNASVLIAYTRPLAKPNTGFVRMLRSSDGGKTFAPPVTVHADRQEITHRFESIGFDAKGVLHTVWIDKRDLEAAPKVGHKSSYRGAAIYRNESTDAGLTFGPDIKVADHSCECCRIALGLGSDGVMRAMWRHVFEPNVRDHAFAALGSPLASIGRATFDGWRVDGCPHHGPALATAVDGFHAVWFGIRQEGADPVPGVRYARLRADGSPLADTVQRLPDERAEHASVVALGSRVAVVWRSVDGMTTTLKAWLSTDSGRSFQLRQLAQVQGDNDFPRLAQLGQRMAVVWRTSSEVQIHALQF
ncbi:hypothetical protein [Rhodoferax sp.]|uniref:hypothetical protein n=1 Tax=Rhodoferax sp. TaxID=50421 RepID=UPI00276454B8|nr:hypothetical protein [Rhodoferax sp.]